MAKTLTIRPGFQQDLDLFEEKLDAYLRNASLDGLRALVQKAAEFLEEEAESTGESDMTHVNNATSAICRTTMELIGRVNTQRRRVAERFEAGHSTGYAQGYAVGLHDGKVIST